LDGEECYDFVDDEDEEFVEKEDFLSLWSRDHVIEAVLEYNRYMIGLRMEQCMDYAGDKLSGPDTVINNSVEKAMVYAEDGKEAEGFIYFYQGLIKIMGLIDTKKENMDEKAKDFSTSDYM